MVNATRRRPRTTYMPSSSREDFEQAHIHIDVVAAQVRTLDTQLAATNNKLDAFQNSVTSMMRDQAATFGQQLAEQAANARSQMEALGSKLDGYAKSGQPDVKGLIITSCAAVTIIIFIIGGFASTILPPMSQSIRDTSTALDKAVEHMVVDKDFDRYRTGTDEWIASQRDRLRHDEDEAARQREEDLRIAVTQHQIEDLKADWQRQIADLKSTLDNRFNAAVTVLNARIEKNEARTDTLDAQLVKRPEIEAQQHAQDAANAQAIAALTQRVDSLAEGLREALAKFGDIFPISEIIKELWSGLRELRSSQESSK